MRAADWILTVGTPYIIARVLEFVSAAQAHKKGTNSRHVAKNELHARLSLYYRPSDVSHAAHRQEEDR